MVDLISLTPSSHACLMLWRLYSFANASNLKALCFQNQMTFMADSFSQLLLRNLAIPKRVVKQMAPQLLRLSPYSVRPC